MVQRYFFRRIQQRSRATRQTVGLMARITMMTARTLALYYSTMMTKLLFRRPGQGILILSRSIRVRVPCLAAMKLAATMATKSIFRHRPLRPAKSLPAGMTMRIISLTQLLRLLTRRLSTHITATLLRKPNGGMAR